MKPGAGVTVWCVFVVTMFAYAASMPGTFQYDDVHTIVRNEAVRDLGNLPRFLVDPTLFSSNPGNAMYRPVFMATLAANHALGGYGPFVWHLTNVLLHALCACLTALLAARLLGIFRPGRPAGFAPLIAGLAFALHPVHSEVANYVSARSGAIAAAGALGAAICCLAATRGARRGPLLMGAAVVCLLLGLGGKEIAVALWPSMVVLELLDPSGGPLLRRIRHAVVRTAPLLVATLAYLFLRVQVLGQAMPDPTGRLTEVAAGADVYSGGGRSIVENLLTQARVFWRYAGLLLVPVNLAIDPFVEVSRSLGDPGVVPAIAGLAVLGLGLLALARRAPLATFLGVWFLLALAPTSTLIPLNVVMNEHRLYLPGVAFAIATGWGLGALIRSRPRAGATLGAAVAVCYLAVLVPRSLVWQDPVRLWEENIRVSPESFRAHNQVGVAYLGKAAEGGFAEEDLPLLDRARASLLEAQRRYKGRTWYNAELNLGLVAQARALVTGDDADFERAVAHLETCHGLVASEYRAREQIANTYGFWKRYDEAIARFGSMADEDRMHDGRRNPRYLYPLAKLSLEAGRPGEAELLYREILAVRREPSAFEGLATALERQGKSEEARETLRRLLEERPADPEARLAAARFLLALDPPDRAGAARHYRRAIELGRPPASPEEADRFLR